MGENDPQAWPIWIPDKQDLCRDHYNNCIATYRPLVKSAYQINVFFLFLNQNICCGYSKELSQ